MKNWISRFNLSFSLQLLWVGIIIIALLHSCNEEPFGDPVHTIHIDYPAVYIVNGASDNLSVIRLSDLTFTEAIDLNEAPYPHHIYAHPNLNLLAVAITGIDLSGGHGGHGGGMDTIAGQRVQLVDAASGDIHHEIPVASSPHNAIFNPPGTELWVPQGDSLMGTILVFSVADWSLLQTIDVGQSPSEVTFSFDGSKAFVANTGEGTVSIIDPLNKTVLISLTTGDDPVGAWPASNGKMYVDNEGDRTITEIDVATSTITATIDLGFVPAFAAYHSSSGELWIADASNGRVAYFLFENGVWIQKGNIVTGEGTHAIAFTGNGQQAFVTNEGANTVSVIDVSSHSVIKTILVGEKPNGIVIKEK